MTAPVLFLHGLEGRPDGTKPSALRAAGLHVTAPDGRGLPLAERVRGGLAALRPGMVLVGSSYGGLAAAAIAGSRAHDLAGLVLLAPALHHAEAPLPNPRALRLPPSLPIAVVHATGDAIVPVAVSRTFVADHPWAELTEVDDAHDLRASLAVIVGEVLRMAGATPTR